MTASSPIPFISDLDPLIICSPTIRSGTTLLQRLLCSSPDTLIFGEHCAQDLETSIRVYLPRLLTYSSYEYCFKVIREKFFSGDTDGWFVDLMPDMDEYLQALGQSCFAGLICCRDYAIRAGRPRWGIKYPGWQPQIIRLLMQMMPRCRFLYIYRDIVDCVKSAKAEGVGDAETKIDQLSAQWATNLNYVLSLENSPNLLLIDFARLIAQSEEMVKRIAEFSGAQNIRAEILSKKVNTRDNGKGKIYTAPAELNDKEMRIIDARTLPLRQRLFR